MHEISVASQRGLTTGRRARCTFSWRDVEIVFTGMLEVNTRAIRSVSYKEFAWRSILDVSRAQGSNNGAESEPQSWLSSWDCLRMIAGTARLKYLVFICHLSSHLSFTHAHTHTHTLTHINIYIYRYSCLLQSTCPHTPTRTHSCNCVCAWENIPAQICAHMHGHIAAVCSFSLIISTLHTHTHTHTQTHTHLIECCHSLRELRFYLRQRLGPLQSLLQLLFGIIQALL